VANKNKNSLIVTLPLEKANGIVLQALQEARSYEIQPLTIAVLDAGGHLVSFQREDGSGILRAEIAIGKAWGALGMGAPSRRTAERLKDRVAFQGALSAASGGRFIPVPGGVLVCNDNEEAIGSVGISGDTSNRDEYCAIMGIKSVGLFSNPDSPQKDWND